MDIFSHIAWAYLLFFSGREDMLQGLFFGIFPDIVFVAVAVLLSINMFARSREISGNKLFPMVRKFYAVSHSFITAAAFGVLASVLSGGFYFPILGWFLHILLDLYTHKGSPVEPQMPFYPFEKPAVKGFIWWRNPYFTAANWAAIIIAYVWKFGMKLPF
ncbi:MAG: hypothetical protein AABX01_06985 [Candidatus Micrarchaeota archaeon]